MPLGDTQHEGCEEAVPGPPSTNPPHTITHVHHNSPPPHGDADTVDVALGEGVAARLLVELAMLVTLSVSLPELGERSSSKCEMQ